MRKAKEKVMLLGSYAGTAAIACKRFMILFFFLNVLRGSLHGSRHEFLHCDTINSGHINMTFRATYRKMDGTTDRYIFQRVNDAVFPCPRDVMHHVEKVTNHIRWKMLRVLNSTYDASRPLDVYKRQAPGTLFP